MEIVRRDPQPAPVNTAPVVEGTVRLRRLVGAALTAELAVFHTRFEPGGRNLLHTHTFDQVLYILEGEGIVATESEEHRVHAGDAVLVPAGEAHWHGATPETAMTHLAFGQPGETVVVGGDVYRPPD